MNNKPVKPTAQRIAIGASLVVLVYAIAVLNILDGGFINFFASVILLAVGAIGIGRMSRERQLWSKYQAENYRYTDKNQQYERRH